MSLLYHEIKSKLNEMDHETKPEDYTNASSSFDDIFLAINNPSFFSVYI